MTDATSPDRPEDAAGEPSPTSAEALGYVHAPGEPQDTSHEGSADGIDNPVDPEEQREAEQPPDADED